MGFRKQPCSLFGHLYSGFQFYLTRLGISLQRHKKVRTNDLGVRAQQDPEPLLIHSLAVQCPMYYAAPFWNYLLIHLFSHESVGLQSTNIY